MRFAIVNESTDSTITGAILELIAGAVERQLYEHFAPFWESVGAPVHVYDSLSKVPADSALVVILDDSAQAGYLGYHNVTPDGRSYARVFWVPIRGAGGTLTSGSSSLSVTLSHEILEIIADPYITFWASNPDTGILHALEACLSPETKVCLAGGEHVPIEVLAERGGEFFVRSSVDGRTVIAKGHKARQTGRSLATIIIRFTDGTSVRCTSDHELLMNDGSFVAAGRLVPGMRLRKDVPPGNPCSDSIDCSEMHLQTSRQTDGTFRRTSYRSNGLFGKFASAVPFSELTSVTRHPFFRRGVQHVFSMAANEKMTGTNAGRVIAPVTNRKFARDRAVLKLIRESVGVNDSFISKLAVAGRVYRPCPEPTFFPSRLFHSRPESFFEGRRAAVVGGNSYVSPMHATPVGGTHSFGSKRSVAVRHGASVSMVKDALSFSSRSVGTATNQAFDHDKIVDSVESGGKTDVYDLTVPDLHNFAISSGIFVHNCDACESESYIIDGISVSNFVGPRFFRKGVGPYDWMGHQGLGGGITAPFKTAPGGYQILASSMANITSVFADGYPDWKKRTKDFTAARTLKRLDQADIIVEEEDPV